MLQTSALRAQLRWLLNIPPYSGAPEETPAKGFPIKTETVVKKISRGKGRKADEIQTIVDIPTVTVGDVTKTLASNYYTNYEPALDAGFEVSRS